MLELLITENTYKFITSNNYSHNIIENNDIKITKKNTDYTLCFELNDSNVNYIYNLVSCIYKNNPTDNNRWYINGTESSLSDEKTIKLVFHYFEGRDNYPLKSRVLSSIIKKSSVNNIQQARELANHPFSGILSFDKNDLVRLTGDFTTTDIPKLIIIEFCDVYVYNRYIHNDFEIHKGNVSFRNCIIEGNLMIGENASVQFSQCIINGKVTCYGSSYVCLSSVNVKEFMLYNSNLSKLHFEFSKIYRFIIHSCKIKAFTFYSNKITEPYIANIDLPKGIRKIDMSQFDNKNINGRIIRKIKNGAQIKIKNTDTFFLTFLISKPIASVTTKDITLDMLDTFLTYGNIKNEHQIYSDLKYKKALYSNTKWRRIFVYLTGAFYIPSRWIVYIIISTILFSALYIGIPSMEFANNTTQIPENLDFWTAIYYSVSQIICSNPTKYTPIGISQICTTIQSILNTMFIANFFASLLNKYLKKTID